jgi:purine-binding chemotaxis protein CheW
MGMVVDGVTGVVGLRADQVVPIPDQGAEQADYLIGLGQVEGRRLILVDIDRLMSIQRGVPLTRVVA